ncbi:MAG: hypothetical protein R2788_10775 [Saprospiraceae bacterium]
MKNQKSLMTNFNLKVTIAFCVIVFFFSQTGFSQISVTAGSKSFFPKGWNDTFIRYRIGSPYPLLGWEAALGSRVLRAKRYRIEYTPSFSFSQFVANVNIPLGFNNFVITKYAHEQLAIQFSIAIYVFDFLGDITDPRHTASIGFLRSHTFFEMAPIFVHYRNKRITRHSMYDYETDLGIGNTVGGSFGLGVDLPLSKSHVLTLLTRFHYFPDYDRNGSPRSIKSDLRQVFIGCRWRVLFNEY